MKTLAHVFLFAVMTMPAFAQADAASQLMDSFLKAWSVGDARALGGLFAIDADFVSPFGNIARGQAAITGYYATAFAHGYAGSLATGRIVSQRRLAPELSLIDAQFTISGAHNPDGSPRTEEKGIMAAILRKDDEGWKIIALRENEGAGEFSLFVPSGF